MGLLTSLLMEHSRRQGQKEQDKISALTGIIGNEKLPDGLREWAKTALLEDKQFKQYKPTMGMILDTHDQIRKAQKEAGAPGQQGGMQQGPPQVAPMPPPMDITRRTQMVGARPEEQSVPQGPSMQALASLPQQRMNPIMPASIAPTGQEITYRGDVPVPSRPEEMREPPPPTPQAPTTLPPMPQTVTRLEPSRSWVVPPVPGMPDAGGGQPKEAQGGKPTNRWAEARKQKADETYDLFEREENLQHAHRLELENKKAAAKGDVREGSPVKTIGPDGKPHYVQWYKSPDGERYSKDLGEVAGTPSKPTKEWLYNSKTDEYVHAYTSPGEAPRDVATGEPISTEFKPSHPPPVERLYGAIQGFYHEGIGLGLDDKAAKAYAGKKFAEIQGAHLARTQQLMAVDTALSGIGPGKGFSTTPPASSSAPPPTSRPSANAAAAPAATPAPSTPASPTPGGTDKTKVAPVPRTVATVLKPGVKPLSSAESKALDMFWGVNAGTIPRNKQTTVPAMAGMEVMKKITGLSGLELQQKLVADKDSLLAMSGMYKDYTSGPTGKSIEAMNTALGHLGELHDATEALKNGDLPILNRIANRYGEATGKDAPTVFKTIVHRVGPEIAKAYIAGGGTAEERTVTEKDFDPSLGAQQILSNIAISGKLFDSKINAAQNRWSQVFKDRPAPFQLSPDAQKTLKKIGVGGSGEPAIGTVENGYRYKGGGAGKKENWVKVQQ